MEEIVEKDDELKKLVREEGLLTASPDFTGRVMHLLEESEKKTSNAYEPLLSRKAWTLILTGMIMIFVFCWWAFTNNNSGELVYSGTVKPVIDFFKNVYSSIHFNNNAMMISTSVIGSMGVLLSLDILLSHKYRRTST